MKKLILIFSIFLSVSTYSQNRHNAYWLSSYVFYDYVNGNNPIVRQDNNGLILSAAIDPRMALDSHAIDRVIYLGYKIGRFEPTLNWERFNRIGFDKYSLSINYAIINKKLSLLVGYELGYTDNKTAYNDPHIQVWSRYGVNVESRYMINKKIYLSLESNIAEAQDVRSKIIRYNGRAKLTLIL